MTFWREKLKIARKSPVASEKILRQTQVQYRRFGAKSPNLATLDVFTFFRKERNEAAKLNLWLAVLFTKPMFV